MKNKQLKRIVKWGKDHELGKYRTWITRLGSYLTPINFTLILYGFIIKKPLGVDVPIWLTLVVIGVPVIMIVDILIMYPSELRYAFRRNKRMTELDRKMDLILDHLGIENVK